MGRTRSGSEDNVTPPPYYPDHPVTRQEWARYLNSVSGTDVRIGWILEQLKKDGVADNTIVVFFADNGQLMPRGIHWCYDVGWAHAGNTPFRWYKQNQHEGGISSEDHRAC